MKKMKKKFLVFTMLCMVFSVSIAQIKMKNIPMKINNSNLHKTIPIELFRSMNKTVTNSDGSTTMYSFKKSDGNTYTRQTQVGTPKNSPRNGFNCTSTTYKLDIANDDFLSVGYDNQIANIYPGAIYTFENFMNGNWKPEGGGRNSIAISTNMTAIEGSSSVTINEPNLGSIRDGILNIYSRFSKSADEITNGSFIAKIYEIHTENELKLAITAGGYGFGFKASDLFNFNSKESKRYFLVDATQEFFSIGCEKPDNGFFKDANRQNNINNGMFISNVTYGRRVLASVEVNVTSTDINNQFKGKYDGAGWGASLDFNIFSNTKSNETTVKMFVVGGAASEVGIVNNASELQSMLKGYFKNASYHNTKPIKYQLSDLDGNTLMSQSATDNYTTQNCAPVSVARLKSANITFHTGTEDKDHDTKLFVKLNSRTGKGIGQINFTNDEKFPDNTFKYFDFDLKDTMLESDFSDGGKMNIKIMPNGNDTWKFSFILNLIFTQDGRDFTKTIDSGCCKEMNQDNRSADWNFDGNFKWR